MTMTTSTLRRLFNIATLCCVSVFAPAALASETLSEADLKALKAQIAETRQTLDDAASRLADLNMQMFEAQYSGDRGSKPMLGVLISDYERNDGIKLVGVTPEGGASEAGLEAGDLLVAVNGYRLDSGDNSMHALKKAMDTVTAGDTVAVEYLRDDVVRTGEITTQARREFAVKMGRDFEIDIDVSELKDLEQLEQLEALGYVGPLRRKARIDQLHPCL